MPGIGGRTALFQQPMHSYKYKDWEGTIPSGRYGAGRVKKQEDGKLLITKASPESIHFTMAHKKHPQRFVMIKPKGWKDKDWLLINKTPTEQLPYEKVRYKKIPAEQVDKYIGQMQKGDTLEAKVDGASSLIKLMKEGVEVMSYRTSKETGRPILHTERLLHGLPAYNIPDDLVGTVLKGELYGVRPGGSGDGDGSADKGDPLRGHVADEPQLAEGSFEPDGGRERDTRVSERADQEDVPGTVRPQDDGLGEYLQEALSAGTGRPTQRERVLRPQELGGLLNSSVAKSIQDQRERQVKLRNAVYDIQQLGNKPIDWHVTPRLERRDMIRKVLEHLPPETFHISEAAETPEAAQRLWQQIQSGEHPITREGVVMHPLHGPPTKGKILEDVDVYYRQAFPGKGKHEGSGAGGFEYSLTPDGPIIGKVGTGFTDELRRSLFENDQDYAGRIARIQSQEQLPSGAYRAPSFLAFHEDQPYATTKQSRQVSARTQIQNDSRTKWNENIQGVGGDETPLPGPKTAQLQTLRRTRHKDMCKVAGLLRELSGRHGNVPRRLFAGEGEQRQRLLSHELHLDTSRETGSKHSEQRVLDFSRRNQASDTMGERVGNQAADIDQASSARLVRAACTNREASSRQKSILVQPDLGLTSEKLAELGIGIDPDEHTALEKEASLARLLTLPGVKHLLRWQSKLGRKANDYLWNKLLTANRRTALGTAGVVGGAGYGGYRMGQGDWQTPGDILHDPIIQKPLEWSTVIPEKYNIPLWTAAGIAGGRSVGRHAAQAAVGSANALRRLVTMQPLSQALSGQIGSTLGVAGPILGGAKGGVGTYYTHRAVEKAREAAEQPTVPEVKHSTDSHYLRAFSQVNPAHLYRGDQSALRNASNYINALLIQGRQNVAKAYNTDSLNLALAPMGQRWQRALASLEGYDPIMSNPLDRVLHMMPATPQLSRPYV